MAKAPKIPNTGRARLLAKPFTKELIDPSAPPVESVKTINEKVLDIDESKDEDLTDGGKINSSNPKGLPGVGKGKRGTKERKGRGEDKVEAAPASGDVSQHQMGATPEQIAGYKAEAHRIYQDDGSVRYYRSVTDRDDIFAGMQLTD